MVNYKVHLINENQNLNLVINCSETTFVLDAAENNNVELPYSCRSGCCSTCLGKIIKGEVDQSDQTFLDQEQLKKGFVLTCIAYPKSDLTLLTHQEENLY